MRSYPSILLLALAGALLAAGPVPAWGQGQVPTWSQQPYWQTPRATQGLFGQRVEGTSLTPGNSTLFPKGGISRGPAGEFNGIDANASGVMFGGLPWQYPRPGQLGIPYMDTQGNPSYGGYVPPAAPVTPATPQQPAVLQPMRQQAEAPTPPAGETPSGAPASGSSASPATQAAPTGQTEWLRNAAGSAIASAGTGATTATTAAAPAPPQLMAPSLQAGFRLSPSGHGPAGEVATMLGRVNQIHKLTPIAVAMQGDTVILRGTVATEHDRGLAEEIARMQPGVWNVHNELSVASPPAARSLGSLPR